MEKSEFLRVSTLARSIAGLNLPDEKAPLVKSRLQRRLDALDLNSVGAYCDYLESSDGPLEIDNFISVLTTNVTRFYREPHHFAHMSDKVLPRILEQDANSSQVRIWSCACSTGAEPYSIATHVAASSLLRQGFDTKILATDIDVSAIAQAKAAEYKTGESKGEAPDQLKKYFIEKNSDTCKISEDVKSIVTVKRLDLTKNWPFDSMFDVVFCRNVVIYFDDNVTENIWRKLAGVVKFGGYLYTGHSERVSGVANKYFDLEAVTTYRRNEIAFSDAIT